MLIHSSYGKPLALLRWLCLTGFIWLRGVALVSVPVFTKHASIRYGTRGVVQCFAYHAIRLTVIAYRVLVTALSYRIPIPHTNRSLTKFANNSSQINVETYLLSQH